MLKDFGAAVEALDAEKAASFYTEDCVFWDPLGTVVGRDGVQDMYELMRDRGDKLEIESVFGTRDWGVIEGIWTTTNREGNTVRIRYCDVLQIQDGKISREHVYFDGRLLR